MEEFTARPQRYLAGELPSALPALCDEGDIKKGFPKQIAWGGFCPVAYDEGGRRYEHIKPVLRKNLILWGTDTLRSGVFIFNPLKNSIE